FQRGKDVSDLKMRVGEFGLLRQNLLKGRNRRFEIVLVDVALRFVQQIVQRIAELLSLARERFPRLILGRQAACRAMGRGEKCKYKTDAGVVHGSTEEMFVSFPTVAEGPEEFDAPFAGRFAWPFACNTRER